MPDELLTENVPAMVEQLLTQGKFNEAAVLVAKWVMASSCKGDEHAGESPELTDKIIKKMKLTADEAKELRDAMNGKLSFAETVGFLTKAGIEIPKGALQDFFEPEIPLYLRDNKNNPFQPAEKRVPALFAIIDQGLQEVLAGRLDGEKLTKYVMKIIRNLDRLEEQGLLPEIDGRKASVERDFINATVERNGQQISVLDLLRLRREELEQKGEINTAKQVMMIETLLEARSREIEVGAEIEDPLKKRAGGWNPSLGHEKENPKPREEGRKENTPASLDKKSDPRREEVLGKYGRKPLEGLPGVNPDRSGANPDRPLRSTKSDK